MAMMDRTGVASALKQIASYLEVQGENPFRIRAFTAAARSVLGFSGEFDAGIADGSLAQVKGIGPAIPQVVTELEMTGRAELLEELRAAVPARLVDMLAIPGLGVAKIRQIREVLAIETLMDLEAAARDGRLALLPRFGQRTAEKILKGIAFLRQASQWRLAHHAAQEAEAFRDAFARLPHILAVHTAGEVRRRCELVRELVTVLVADVPPHEVFHQLGGMLGVNEIAGDDERRVTLRFAGGGRVHVVVTPPQNLGVVLVQATGSVGHLAALERRAGDHGFNLAGTALWHGSRFVPTPTEESLYQALDLSWIPPELREPVRRSGLRCHAWLSVPTCAVSSTAIPALLTAAVRSERSPSRVRRPGISTSGSPVIRARQRMPVTCRSRMSASNGRRSMPSTHPGPGSRCSRESKATSSSMAPWTIRIMC